MAILNLDKKSQVMWFRNGLREQVKDLLIARDLSTNFNDFVALCIKLDNAWRYRQEEKRVPGTAHPLRFNSTTTGRNTTATGTAPGPMDLSIVNGKLSPEVRQYRMANNLFNYCGQSGYFEREYSNKKNRSQKVAVVAPRIPEPLPETVFQSKNLGTQDWMVTHSWVTGHFLKSLLFPISLSFLSSCSKFLFCFVGFTHWRRWTWRFYCWEYWFGFGW